MKRLIKSTMFLMILSCFGYIAYGLSKKLKEIKNQYEHSIFFNGKTLKFDGKEFEGGSYAAVCSGVEMDFTNATLLGDVRLELYGRCSGISIMVPEDWQIKVSGEADKSGVSNRTNFDEIDETKQILYIHYDIKYSGLEIKYSNEN